MSVTYKFILFQSVISGGFLFGYFLKKAAAGHAEKIVKKILRFNIIIFEPLIVLNSAWGITITPDLMILPAAGLLIVLIGFFSGTVVSPFIFKDKIKKATFIITASLSNHGFTMGAFICYILIGFQGLALSFVFTIYFTFYVFIFIFNYASAVRFNHTVSLKFIIRKFFQLQNLPLYSISAALLLSLSGIKRPVPVLNLDVFIYAVVFLYFLSLGMQFDLKQIKDAVRPSVFLAVLKFCIIPFIIIIILFFVPVSHDMRAVIIIQSFMPTGVFSVVTASLYDLDTRLASALFVFNTVIYAAAVLPLTLLFRNLIL
ncbi:MAG: AEC family transporter [Spirochaetes bacterium]|nr:AEC family transporter [Spirochaetota bacterium]